MHLRYQAWWRYLIVSRYYLVNIIWDALSLLYKQYSTFIPPEDKKYLSGGLQILGDSLSSGLDDDAGDLGPIIIKLCGYVQ